MRRISAFLAVVFWATLTTSAWADVEGSPSELHRTLSESKARLAKADRSASVDHAASLAQVFYDVSYYDLDITVLPATSQVAGRVIMNARSLKNDLSPFDMDLYLAMTADSVKMNGSPVTFSHPGSELYITPPAPLDSGDTFSVEVFYHGPPASGGFGAFGFNTHGSPSAPIIWSLSEPYYARNWWPCKDTPSDKADSVDIRITCPSTLFAASNGELVSQTDLGTGFKKFHWRHRYPIVTYLVSLAISNFTQLDYQYVYNGGADTMPVHFWVYPEQATNAQNAYPEVLQMLDAFGEAYGPYPFLNETYAISHFPWGGGMEHQTNTSPTPGSYSRNLTSHELSHQWWGDNVTCRNWKHIWLNEGFASYSEAIYQEWLFGPATYRSYMNGMVYKGGGTVIVDDTTNVDRIFHGGLSYDKGAWVVHMLRGVLGDDLFFDALAEYRARFQGRSATTEDLQAACEQVSGLDLSQFFADWCYGTFYPRYIYGYYLTGTGTQQKAHLRLEQFQGGNPQVFDMPVDVRFSSSTDGYMASVQNTQRVQWFEIPLSFTPTTIEFDPMGWILKDAFAGVGVTTDSLKPARRDDPYTDTLRATRGQAPYTWSLVSPSNLPTGLTLTPEGVISGVPSLASTFKFTVMAQDNAIVTTRMEREITLVVNQPLRPDGDMNADGFVTSGDVVFLVNYVFKAGPAPAPLSFGDLDLSCSITAADIIYLVNFVFKSGPQPLGSCVVP